MLNTSETHTRGLIDIEITSRLAQSTCPTRIVPAHGSKPGGRRGRPVSLQTALPHPVMRSIIERQMLPQKNCWIRANHWIGDDKPTGQDCRVVQPPGRRNPSVPERQRRARSGRTAAGRCPHS
eukprot:5089830-Pleurochrysis_carterae.AAC.4